MDATIKAKWLAALRSGEYTQGKGYLVVPERAHIERAGDSAVGSRCCLGVLAAVIPDLELDGNSSYLPAPVGARIGVRWSVQNTLARMNDNDNASFAQIADWIEANL